MTASRRQIAWLLLPWLCGFGALTFIPLLASFGLSFTRVRSDLS